MYAHTHTHACTHTRTHTHTHVRTYTHNHSHIHACTHTHTHVRTHTQTHARMYAHTRTHVRTHRHTHIERGNWHAYGERKTTTDNFKIITVKELSLLDRACFEHPVNGTGLPQEEVLRRLHTKPAKSRWKFWEDYNIFLNTGQQQKNTKKTQVSYLAFQLIFTV